MRLRAHRRYGMQSECGHAGPATVRRVPAIEAASSARTGSCGLAWSGIWSPCTPAGGAGTDTAAARTRPAAIIAVVADDWTAWPRTPPPGAHCVIAALTSSHTTSRVPAWIHTIDIPAT